MSSKTADLTALNWTEWKYDPEASMEKAMRETDWHKLCQLASDLKDGMSCVPLDRTTNGLNNMVRLLQFSDGTLWVARIAMRKSAADLAKLSSEIDVMRWIHTEQPSLAVPQIFACQAEVDEHNAVGVPFVLMEFVPGNTAMNAAGGYETHHGEIPKAYRPRFYRAVAECHVKMTALQLPKIGTIRRNRDGVMEVGPFPDIGGPFSTATAYLEAWAKHAQFLRTPDEIREIMHGSPLTEQIVHAIDVFPRRFRDVAPRLVCHDHGPFPLFHRDFLHSNMIVDDDFHVLSIIDWEGACTLPRELVQFPRFLAAAPRLFGAPERYDEDGQPLDDDERQRWRERQDYVQMVQSFEGQQDQHDCTLSTCLAYDKGQALSHIMDAYEGGRMGFYDKVMDELEAGLVGGPGSRDHARG